MILDAARLEVRYAGTERLALRGVSVRVEAGELVAVAGPNGSGKTTLVRAVTGLVPLGAGEVRVQGRSLARWPREELARVLGVVPQREDIAFPLRVDETVMLGRYARLGPLGAPRAEDLAAVAAAMARCDASALAARSTDTLSGGEWQRVRLARALAQEPSLLLLDEPTASLDPDIGDRMRSHLENYQRMSGCTMLLASHNMSEVERMCDDVIMLRAGAVVDQGSPGRLIERYGRDTMEEVFLDIARGVDERFDGAADATT
jgi:ABC-type cobalamin/Fe3+-siderophores transport system ATPase subunit